MQRGHCVDCKKEISKDATRCRSCRACHDAKEGLHRGGRKKTYQGTFCVDCKKAIGRYRTRCNKCRGNNDIKHWYTCLGCGVRFHNKRHCAQEGTKYCSKQCLGISKRTDVSYRARLLTREPKRCVVCSTVIPRKNHYCSRECYRSTKRVDNSRPVDCTQCGKSFMSPSTRARRFCSPACNKKYFRNLYGSRSARKRARYYGVPYEHIDINAIFHRDGWKCMMCNKNTPMDRRGTMYSNAPEIDHVIPLSKGGGHTMDNVQCACRSCNRAKSNKRVYSQMSMELSTYG